MPEMTPEQIDDLWKDLIDEIEELRLDFKGNRRGLRHLRSHEQTIREINNALGLMIQKTRGRKIFG